MTDNSIRVGIIGASSTLGWARHSHVPALGALREYELAAACTAQKDSAEAAARQFGAPKAYWDYRALLKDPDIDAVIVTVRAPLHHEIVMAALQAGKHVYCEWPLAVNACLAQEMADVAAQHGLCNMVGLQARGDPSLIHMRNLITQGWIGDIVSARMEQVIPGLIDARHPTRAWKADVAAATNSHTKDGGHALDAFCWCLGPFAELSGSVTVRAPEWTLADGSRVSVTGPDHLSITGFLANGAVASIVVATVPWHAPGVRIEVYGTAGTLLYTTRAKNVNRGLGRLEGALGSHPELEFSVLEPPSELLWAPAELPVPDAFKVGQMLRRFAQCIRGSHDSSPTFSDAAAHQRLLEAIGFASQTRSWVRWDSVTSTAQTVVPQTKG